jgi:hypothetical protein
MAAPKLTPRIETPRTVLTLFDSSNLAEVDFLLSLYVAPEVSGMQKAHGVVTNVTAREGLLDRFRLNHLDPTLPEISGGFGGHCLYLVNARPGTVTPTSKDTEESLDTYIGFVALNHRVVELADIGYIISPSVWGQGYATEACKALLDHVTGEMGVKRVCAYTRPGHKASMRVLEKSGFVYVGTGALLEKDGSRHEGEMFVVPGLEGEGVIGGSLEGWAFHVK